MKNISILILAAGKGERMRSELPKVLHPVGGVPMIERVIKTVSRLKPSAICVIVGHGSKHVEKVLRETFPKLKLTFVLQKNLNGSGGAVRQALPWLKKQKGNVIVTCGDAPLITSSTFAALTESHQKEDNSATVLTAIMENPAAYGRIVRTHDRAVSRIVEHLDATDEERKISEINTGTYCFNAARLCVVLPRLKNDNAKKEFYLTDTLSLLRETGRVGAVVAPDAQETQGINNRVDLAAAEKTLNQRKLFELMKSGVSVVDPASTFVSEEAVIGADTIIWPQTFILGQSKIGSGCQIGPWAHLKNMNIENNAAIQASFCEDSVVRSGARVGPFSRVRPRSDVGAGAHLGNFSEIKNAKLGTGAKANHLSYLGDATIGKNVNIGAGTITCNYDGIQKFPTQIQDHAFIGSNVNLVAPVRIGSNAVVGAGSTITRNVPPWALALERSSLVMKKGWVKKRKKKGKKK